MKTPIAYYGGKQKMTHHILPLIPRHTVYVEPFAGGAAVFFAKPWPTVTNREHYREVINDNNYEIINFYEQLRDRGHELCEKLALTLYSEAEHRKAKHEKSDDKLQAAIQFFVNSQQSFAGVINGGWGRSVYGRNLASTWMKKISDLPLYIERMSAVHIACDDALKVIKQFDSPQTFFYCDPPYPGTDCGHYKGYSVADLKNLIDVLNNCHGSFLLSNYEQPDVVIPTDWERFEFQRIASSRGRVNYDRSKQNDETEQNRKRTEIVWRRFNRTPVREEIQKLYDSGLFNCFATPLQELWS